MREEHVKGGTIGGGGRMGDECGLHPYTTNLAPPSSGCLLANEINCG